MFRDDVASGFAGATFGTSTPARSVFAVASEVTGRAGGGVAPLELDSIASFAREAARAGPAMGDSAVVVPTGEGGTIP
jgi:hypothetical protein